MRIPLGLMFPRSLRLSLFVQKACRMINILILLNNFIIYLFNQYKNVKTAKQKENGVTNVVD